MRRPRVLLGPLLAILLALTPGCTPLSADAALSQFERVHTVSGGASSIVSTAPGEVWVAGRTSDDTFVLEHYAQGAWTPTTLPGVTGGTLAASAPDDIWLDAGDSFRHYNGTDWQPVDRPVLPEGAELVSVGAMFDAPGPMFYAGFSYVREGSFTIAFARFDGSYWTLLGAPPGDFFFESVQQIAVVDDVLVARVATHQDAEQYLVRYESGGWTEPVQTGRYFCCSFNQWASDWVVDSATDIWLYGTYTDENTAIRAWCGHYNGTGLATAPCVAGSGVEVTAAAELPDGRHLVASGQFHLLRQPDEQTPVEGEGAVVMRQLVAEPETGVVWALAAQPGVTGTAVLRYGVATDTGQHAVTVETPTPVERGGLLTVRGTIYPVSGVAADRGLVLQVQSGSSWTRVAAARADASGQYRLDAQAPTAGVFTYRVKKFATGDLAVGYSSPFTVAVLEPFQVTIRAASKVTVGRPVTIRGKVTPTVDSPDQRTVELQTKSGTSWAAVASTTTNAAGTYRFRVTETTVGTRRYRVVKTPTDRKAAFSPVVKVAVTSEDGTGAVDCVTRSRC